MNDLSELPTRLRALRYNMGYRSAETFSARFGLNRSIYQRWESGKDIKLSNLFKLAKIHGITVSELLK